MTEKFAAPAGWKLVPMEMTPEQIAACQMQTEMGGWWAAGMAGAYADFEEFYRVALASAPTPEQHAENQRKRDEDLAALLEGAPTT